MTTLLDRVLDAHGGLDRWRQHRELRATIVTTGALFDIKAMPQSPQPRTMTVAVHAERASVTPFGAPDQRTAFTPDRIAIEKLDGTPIAERDRPHEHFAGHDLNSPWDPLDRAYFNGYALWTYLTSPFLLAFPGVRVTEIEPVTEAGQRWAGLRATLPPELVSHSTDQDFYFDPDLRLRRHDYRFDIGGGFPAIQYIDDHVEADGFLVPTRRRAYRANPDGTAAREQLMVGIDVSDIRIT